MKPAEGIINAVVLLINDAKLIVADDRGKILLLVPGKQLLAALRARLLCFFIHVSHGDSFLNETMRRED